MKLLFCPLCHDAHGLTMTEWRTCLCGKSGGQYNVDGMTATLGGEARVFGVGNPFFEYLYPFLAEEGKKRMWKKYYGHELGDCWWGEYEGDNQILRVLSPDGPRLKLRVRNQTQTGPTRIPDESGMNFVTVLDKRKFQFLGVWHENEKISFNVPANFKVNVTRWSKEVKSANKRRNKHHVGNKVQG